MVKGLDCILSTMGRPWRARKWQRTDVIRFVLRKFTLAPAEAGRQSHGENIPVAKAKSDMVCQGDRQ